VIARTKLVRPRTTRKVAGVCAGFAEYFDIDVTLIRVVWLILAILTFPVLFVVYAVCWIVVPEEPLMLMAPPVNASTQKQGA
jgi:phage shock protein C